MTAASGRRALAICGLLVFVSPGQASSEGAAMDRIMTPDDVIVVTEASRLSDGPYDILQSNIDFLNALFNERLTHGEVSADALQSYYVDYYLAQVNNGGFSQFVYNSRFSPELQGIVRTGLQAMGAKRNLELFERGAE